MTAKTRKIIYTDGGTRNNGSFGNQESYICAVDEDGEILFFKEIGDKTNNEAELTAILELLQTTEGEIDIRCDSQLAIHLVKGQWKTHLLRLKLILNKIKKLGRVFDIKWIGRDDNLAGLVMEERVGL